MRHTVGVDSLLCTATYGPFRSSTPDVVVEQIQAVRDAGADGAALFAYNQLSAPQPTSLTEGVFRTKAFVPDQNLAAASRAGLTYTRNGWRRHPGVASRARQGVKSASRSGPPNAGCGWPSLIGPKHRSPTRARRSGPTRPPRPGTRPACCAISTGTSARSGVRSPATKQTGAGCSSHCGRHRQLSGDQLSAPRPTPQPAPRRSAACLRAV
jgi:hypothetical protein